MVLEITLTRDDVTHEAYAKVESCFITRRKLTRKQSLYGINEHFEAVFNAVRECEATFAYSSHLDIIDACFSVSSKFCH
ncbi:MAG: hypothetical protein BECKG1743F_GA0114225_101575 [Candidatus Kentron sp. G]|nr:MAG: hypothetical protein BECKG1743F_GA0114225_101575 [Candidatus Kentron sp. G]